MLTLYYVSATFLQSWRIKNICQKISQLLSQQVSIAFYTIPLTNGDGFDAFLANSELCFNRSAAKVSQMLWLCGNYRGCCLEPLQVLHTTPWITFPDAPGLQPFSYDQTPTTVLKNIQNVKQQSIHILLEADIQPCQPIDANDPIVNIENYGRLIAWKIDTHLAVLIESNIEYLSKLLVHTFMHNSFLINDHLTLLRIESVKSDGKPQPFEKLSSHLRKSTRTTKHMAIEEWSKHLEDLKSLSVLANQACEFSYNKNRTEGKTGIIKPDLIPPELRAASEMVAKGVTNTSADTELGSATQKTDKDDNADVPKAAKEDQLVKSSKADAETKAMEKSVLNGEDESVKKTDAVKEGPKVVEDVKIEEGNEATKRSKLTESVETKSSTIIHKTTPTAQGNVLESSDKAGSKQEDLEKTNLHSSISSISTISTATENLIQSEKQIPSQQLGTASTTKKFATETTTTTTTTTPTIVTRQTSRKLKAKPTQFKKSFIISGPQKHPINNESSELEKIAKAKVTTRSNSKSPSEKDHQQLLQKKKSSSTSVSPSKAITPSEPAASSSTNNSMNIKEAVTTNVNTSTSQIVDNTQQRPVLQRHKDSLKESKPPNVLIYAESAITRQSVISTIKNILCENTYTIYNLSTEMAQRKYWSDTTALLIVCGLVPKNVGEIFVDYFLNGGKLLSLCSDVLHFILPNYRTAEVREHELVQFSYDKWHKVKMMHHIFCYQASPVRKNFSTESEENASSRNSRKPAQVCLPRSIELVDMNAVAHKLDVKVLGMEETWQTPSLLLARNTNNDGVAVISQVHLEISPSEFESDDSKFAILQENETIRLEIFADLLKIYFGLDIQTKGVKPTAEAAKTVFQYAYFLGRHEAKFALLEKLKARSDANNVINTENLSMKFCGPGEQLPIPTNNFLPIMIHSCPSDFSTVEYFDNLRTNYVGRLVIYAPVVSSSQHIIKDLSLANGIVVIARQQTAGIGRDKNQWISPAGCCMFSIQLSMPLNSVLGKRLSLVQHIVATAIVNALKTNELYKNLDIALKWPNDIYAYGINKLGGLCLHSYLTDEVTINIGCGINLDNEKPTVCLNGMIREYNKANRQQLPLLKYEEFLAMIFNEIEQQLIQAESGDFDAFYKLYYSLWLHSDQSIAICDADGSKRSAKIIGIDDSGYLLVKLLDGKIETVYPNGNSFDMLKGLIISKL